jgi:hypothetical protein
LRVARTAAATFTIEFESEEELRAEYASNLSSGGLRLPSTEKVALFTTVSLTFRLAGRGEASARGTVVGHLPAALALAIEGSTGSLLEALLVTPDEPVESSNAWDRLRAMPHVQKLLLAAKAERSERAILVQDSDPQVLFSLLKNPRIGAEEVARVAKSAHISFQAAELIVKTPQWMSNVEVKLALVHNPRTPSAMALRILPTLPQAEVARVARGAAVSQALKQAALRLLVG